MPAVFLSAEKNMRSSYSILMLMLVRFTHPILMLMSMLMLMLMSQCEPAFNGKLIKAVDGLKC